MQQTFVESFFESEEEYNVFAEEFNSGVPLDLYNEYEETTGAIKSVQGGCADPWETQERTFWVGVKLPEGIVIYSLVRSSQPDGLIQTGVANSWSTTCILAAQKNASGTLHSTYFPTKADEVASEYTKNHLFGNAVIPKDRDPGWLAPDQFRDRWELNLGRSQRLLPEILAESVKPIIFITTPNTAIPA